MQKLTVLIIIIFAASNLFASAGLMTPAEKSSFSQITSYTSMMDFLLELDKQCPFLEMKTIGYSVENRPIPALFFSEDRKFDTKNREKPLTLIYCQQHGNEPAGKEAALILTRDLALENPGYLEKFDLIIIPSLNPDGNEADRRRNSADIDLNRDHTALSQPETQALHTLFLQYLPEIALDVHEYTAASKEWIEQGIIKDAEIMIDCCTNLNLDSAILNYSKNVIIPSIDSSLSCQGVRFHRYVVGNPFGNNRIRNSTTTFSDGRQSIAFFGTFSFIQEGKKYDSSLPHLKDRAFSQLKALNAFLLLITKQGDEMKKIVQNARLSQVKQIDFPADMVHIQMDYAPSESGDSLNFPLFDLYEWEPVTKYLHKYHSKVVVNKSVSTPYAYVFPQEFSLMKDWLKQLGFKVYRLSSETRLKVQNYSVLSTIKIMEEDYEVPVSKVTTHEKVIKFPQGTFIVYVNQLGGSLLPLILEPQSSNNFLNAETSQTRNLSDWVIPGKEYPFYRLIETKKLNLIETE